MTKSKVIYIFNPDTDYALVSGSPYYTPPKSILRLAEEMAMLPAEFAGWEDKVIPYLQADRIIDIVGGKDRLANYTIRPWGWNHRIRRILMEAGVPESMLPSVTAIEQLRELSHRRSTIKANELLNKHLISMGVSARHLSPLPIEFDCVDELFNYYLTSHGEAFLKAPWSSSGRGIMYTGDNNETQIREWVHGIIRRQGSVMYETAADKVLDFATEWYISEGAPEYLGLSLFEASARGKYHRNVELSQSEIMERIKDKAPDFSESFIESQRRMLRDLISNKYEGPLGIDMLAEKDGSIRSCIELNLRMTMGHATLLKLNKAEN